MMFSESIHSSTVAPSANPLEKMCSKAMFVGKDVLHQIKTDFYAGPILRKSANLIGGLGVTAASSVAFGLTVTPALKEYVKVSGEHFELLRSIPWVGNFAHEVLGKAGALGALSVAAPFLGLVTTLVESQGPWSDRIHWLGAHIALGFSSSPVWLLPVSQATGVLPALVLAVACSVGVSAVLNQRIEAGHATVKMLAVGATLVLSGAPLMAQVATGVPLAAAMTYGGVVIAAGACVLAGYLVASSWSAISDESTAELRATMVTSGLGADRLNLPNESNPTVFCSEKRLIDNVVFLKHCQETSSRLGVQTILLSGPAGTGKTSISRAIANHLSAVPCIIKPSKILTADNPANEIRKLFDQAKLLNQALVFFFDDAESLFGNRHEAGDAKSDRDLRRLITTTLNDCIQGVESSQSPLTLVILSTNDRDHLDESLLSRFAMCDVEIKKPSAKQVSAIFDAVFRDEIGTALANNGWSRADKPSKKLTDYVVKRFESENLEPSGRDLKNLCASVAKRAISEKATSRKLAFAYGKIAPEEIFSGFVQLIPEEISRLKRNNALFDAGK